MGKPQNNSNLIVLYGNDAMFVEINEIDECGNPIPNYEIDDTAKRLHGLQIDVTKYSWIGADGESRPIGESRLVKHNRVIESGIIGVYDKTNFEHLKNLVKAVGEVVEHSKYNNIFD